MKINTTHFVSNAHYATKCEFVCKAFVKEMTGMLLPILCGQLNFSAHAEKLYLYLWILWVYHMHFFLKSIVKVLFLIGSENSQVSLKAKGDEVTCYPQEDVESSAELGSSTRSKFWNPHQKTLPGITELQTTAKACFQNQAKATDD